MSHQLAAVNPRISALIFWVPREMFPALAFTLGLTVASVGLDSAETRCSN